MARSLVAAALALCLIASAARANVLLVYHELRNNVDCESLDCFGPIAQRQHMQSILDRFGIPYKAVWRGNTRTEWVRTGAQVWGSGAGAYTEQFDAVIHLSTLKNRLGVGGPDFADSIGMATAVPGVTKYPTVPQIFFSSAGTDAFVTASGRDSSGSNSATDGYIGSDVNYWHLTKYLTTDPSIRWRSGFLHGQRLAYTPSGGYRVLVAQNVNASGVYERAPGSVMPCLDCDSIGVTSDTALVWVRLNNNVSGAAQMVYVNDVHLAYTQMDPTLALIALAYVDSLTGGSVFENKDRLPLGLGINVRGGWRRSARHVMGGISPNDTTQLKASIDSLASLRIPFTVGVNVDSLADYSADRYWWLRASPYVYFTPENHGGLDTAAANNGPASWQRPRDPFGRYRNRTLAQSGATDTSLATLVRANFWKVDSAFGASRTDRIAIPPADDWWPYNWRPNNPNAGTADSLFAYLSDSAGVRGIVINPYGDGGNRSGLVNRKSPIRNQGATRLRYGRSRGSTFNVIATGAPSDSGSARWTRVESIDSYEPGSPMKGVQNFFHSAFGAGRWGGQGGVYEPVPGDSLISRASIFTIHASDLGTGTHASGRPTMPGWWQVKNVVMPMKAVNKVAGRTIVSFRKSQDIEP